MLRNTFLFEFQLNPLNGLKGGVANFELSLRIGVPIGYPRPPFVQKTFISGGEIQNTIHFSLKGGGTKTQTERVAQNT